MHPLPEPTVEQVFGKTAGQCADCGRALSRVAFCYGGGGLRGPGAWVVEYRVVRGARGQNACDVPHLWPVCCSCHTARNGGSDAPYVPGPRDSGRPLLALAAVPPDDRGDWAP